MIAIQITAAFDATKVAKAIHKIDKKVADLEGSIVTLGNEAARRMRDTIDATTYRSPSTGTLRDSIEVHVNEAKAFNSFSVGIGRISDLPIYWSVMNYGVTRSGVDFYPGRPAGASVSKGVRGSFQGQPPEAGLAGSTVAPGKSRFSHSREFFIRSGSPVAPKNYIEKTIFWLRSNWTSFMT